MTEEKYDKEFIEILKGMSVAIDEVEEGANARLARDDVKGALSLITPTVFMNARMFFRTAADLLDGVNKINKELEKLPNKKEFDKIKSEVHKQRKKIRTSLDPLKQALEEQKMRQQRGDEVYG